MKKILLLSIAIIVLLVNCQKKKHCKGRTDDVESGIIVSKVTFDCFNENPPSPLQNGYVINSDTAYQALGLKKYTKDECQNATLPFIDFTQYTLLGKMATGGCRVGFKRDVARDDTNSQYLYKIIVCEYGMCKSEGGEYELGFSAQITARFYS